MEILAHSPGGGVFDQDRWRTQLRLALCLRHVVLRLEALGAVSPRPLDEVARQIVNGVLVDLFGDVEPLVSQREPRHDQ